MFGLFKKKITPEELGMGVMQLALDHLVTHAKQSMAWCFDGVNASDQDENTIGTYWAQFLIKNGVSEDVQRNYIVRFSHAVIQTMAQRFDLQTRKQITRGAMSAMKTGPDYDFESVFSEVEGLGRAKFGSKIDTLMADGPGANIAKYLLAACLVLGVKKSEPFLENFSLIASTIGGSIGTASRAIDYGLSKFKL